MVDYRLGRIASQVPITGRWLDCGCADGNYAVELMRRGAAEVIGSDIESSRIAEARARWVAEPRVQFVSCPAEALPFDDAFFDGVLLNEVLEHVSDQAKALAEIRRVLAPSGMLVVFSPNRWFPFEGHGATFGHIRLPFPVPLHPWLPQRLTARTMNARNYWPRQLAAIVAEAGFEIQTLDWALPLLTKYRWLPDRAIRWYTRNLHRIDRVKPIRRWGVSTMVIARRPDQLA